jgi:broad specificity phosphatase PhoE
VAATTILLVRHGETDWNRDRRVQGHTDVPLNDVGRDQAETLAAELASQPFSAVYSSDLARALDTARILASVRSLPVTTEPALREKSFGTWEGLTEVEVLARFPDAHAGAWGDGESTEEMAARVLAGLRAIVAAHPGETVLVVTHGGPMRAVLRECGAEDGPIANCRLVALVSDDGVLRARA